MEKKCNCKEPYDEERFQGGYPYCPVHDNREKTNHMFSGPLTPERELIYRIVEQWGNAVEMPNMEGWLKEYAAKRASGPIWVKATTRLPAPGYEVFIRHSNMACKAAGDLSLIKEIMETIADDVEWLDEQPE